MTTKAELQTQLNNVKADLKNAALVIDREVEARQALQRRVDIIERAKPRYPQLSIKFVGGHMDGQKHAISNDRFPSHYMTPEPLSRYEAWNYDYSNPHPLAYNPRRVEYRFLKPMATDPTVGIYEVIR